MLFFFIFYGLKKILMQIGRYFKFYVYLCEIIEVFDDIKL